MNTKWPYSQAFALIADLHRALGLPNMKDMGQPWKQQVGEHWEFILNGAGEPVQASDQTIPPYTAAIYFDGFPVGIVDPTGGAMLRGKDIGEDAFIAALEAAIHNCITPSEGGR